MESESRGGTDHPSIVMLERELFARFDELFQAIAGRPPERFDNFESVRAAVLDRGSDIGRSGGSIDALRADLAGFYSKHGPQMFRDTKTLGGLKFVLGGSGRFVSSQFDAVRKLALYADTILVPDPVLPWFETNRSEEKFRHVLELEALYHILQLRPLVDADLPYPAVIVFPSWEKTLEASDPETIARQSRLVSVVLSQCLSQDFQSPEEFLAYAKARPQEFLSIVERGALFVAPGQEGRQPRLSDAISAYRDYIRTWRGGQHAQVASFPDEALVASGLVERIAPQFHLIENAEELAAQPMLALPVHWHYFELCRRSFAGKLTDLGLLDPGWSREERALQDPNLSWLGNVPIADLVRLRGDNENEAFRRRLDEMTHVLQETAIEDVNRVAPEVIRSLHGLIAEHQKRVREVTEEYQNRHTKTAVASIATAVATFAPVLAPVLGIVPGAAAAIAVAAKYTSDKLDERAALRQLSRSLFGVLASAEKQSKY